jgi:hypothetical protein
LERMAEQGVDRETIERVREFQEMTRELEQTERQRREGEAMRDRLRSPYEEFEARVADVRKLLDVGAIGTTTAARALLEAQRGFVGSAAGARPGIAGWAEEGSAEAYSAIVRANQEDPKVELIEQTNKILQKEFGELKGIMRREAAFQVAEPPPG